MPNLILNHFFFVLIRLIYFFFYSTVWLSSDLLITMFEPFSLINRFQWSSPYQHRFQEGASDVLCTTQLELSLNKMHRELQNLHLINKNNHFGMKNGNISALYSTPRLDSQTAEAETGESAKYGVAVFLKIFLLKKRFYYDTAGSLNGSGCAESESSQLQKKKKKMVHPECL